MSKTHNETAKYAYDGLDRTIHEKARLSILTSLISHPDGIGLCRLEKALRPNRWQSQPPRKSASGS